MKPRDKAVGRKKISVLLETDQAHRFEAFCKAQGYKKSTLIARLIREHLDTQLKRGTPPEDQY